MNIIYTALVCLVAALQASFCVLEIFLWNTPKGHKIFQIKPDFAKESKVLAANQGLYNLFFTAGLLLSFFLDPQSAFWLQIFCLSSVAVAGIYGAITVSKKILWIQATPAILALAIGWYISCHQ